MTCVVQLEHKFNPSIVNSLIGVFYIKTNLTHIIFDLYVFYPYIGLVGSWARLGQGRLEKLESSSPEK